MPALIAVGVAISMLVCRRMLRPIEALAEQAAAIGPQSLSSRVHVPGKGDELDVLATSLNDALARIEQAFSATRTFARDAAHELRTPLARMRVEVERLKARPRSPGAYEEGLAEVRLEIEELSEIVSRLLSLAKLESGAAAVGETVDLAAVVRAVVAEMAEEAAPRRLRLVAAAGDEDYSLTGDRLQLQQFARNVLGNAIKFTEGSADTLVEVAIAARNGAIELTVEDNGPGFRAEDLALLSQPFFRGHETPGVGGAGLGLAISKRVAAAHGGELELSNGAGGGARVTVRFRAAQQSPMPASARRIIDT